MFVAWLSLPYYERKPKTQRDLAKALGVAEWTLSRWKYDGALDEAMALAEHALRERHGEILRALGDKAAAGDVQAIRTYLETICQRGAAARIQVNTTGPTQINIAELVRETEKVDALPAWLESEAS